MTRSNGVVILPLIIYLNVDVGAKSLACSMLVGRCDDVLGFCLCLLKATCFWEWNGAIFLSRFHWSISWNVSSQERMSKVACLHSVFLWQQNDCLTPDFQQLDRIRACERCISTHRFALSPLMCEWASGVENTLALKDVVLWPGSPSLNAFPPFC